MVVWEVEATDEFVAWYSGCSTDTQARIDEVVDRLADHGPDLGRPLVDTIAGSRLSN
jgi:hypothetical protein